MMLHDQDTKVLMLDESDNKKIFYMDLEKGKVVTEYVIRKKQKNNSNFNKSSTS